jgi:hypothetical protein
MQSLKQEALESLRQLPADADIDEIMHRRYVIDKLLKSRADIERDEVIGHDDLKRETGEW